jgi:hypothetical protein
MLLCLLCDCCLLLRLFARMHTTAVAYVYTKQSHDVPVTTLLLLLLCTHLASLPLSKQHAIYMLGLSEKFTSLLSQSCAA